MHYIGVTKQDITVFFTGPMVDEKIMMALKEAVRESNEDIAQIIDEIEVGNNALRMVWCVLNY